MIVHKKERREASEKRKTKYLSCCSTNIIGIGGKQYMDKKAIEKDYQQGIGLIQKYVSNYLVENYEGIEKIEWQGVRVEWRNAKGYGPSLLGNYANIE